ncbi:MAG: hypothetical protein IT210_00010 [Armatimonadetes bacterium]|nr:hypothetical protein [Armatimonadota bacterium]
MWLVLFLLALAIWPQPRELARKTEAILKLPVRIEAAAGLEGPARLLRREMARLFGVSAVRPGGGTRIALKLVPQSLPRPEEYILETTGSRIDLRAHDGQGAYWAVHSLIQWLGSGEVRRLPQGFAVPGVRMRDWPEPGFRGFMTQGPWSGTVEELKRNLDLQARMKIRYFALEFGPRVIFDFDPSIARGMKLTKARAKSVIDYGRSLGLEPVGYLNMLGHLERAYEKPPYTGHGGIMIQNLESYDKFVFPVLSEMLEIYGPVRYFHCGMDEAWDLFTWFSEQGMSGSSLLARHLRLVRDFFRARGIRMVIWHDMFVAPELEKELGAQVGPANGGPPRNTASALDDVPGDIVLDYWFYDPLEKYPALDYLKRKGFEMWASPWQTPFSLVRYARERNVPSFGTLWAGPPDVFYSHAFNPVTAFYAQAAWNPSAAPDSVHPEPRIAPAAKEATAAELWGRRTLAFPSSHALLLRPGRPGNITRLAWPKQVSAAREQYSGVPFDFTSPALFPPLPGRSKPLERGSEASYVALPGGEKLPLDGFNTGRGEDQLILYAAPQSATGTNIYGTEVSVSAGGKVLEVSDYGGGDMPVPSGGFVLSAHSGPDGARARRLLGLRPGERVAVFDKEGNWLGGYRSGLGEVPAEQAARLLSERKWSVSIGPPCSALYLAAASESSLTPGALLGSFHIRFADGSLEAVPIRYALEALSVENPDLPHTSSPSVWLIRRPTAPRQALVREWLNPRPDVPIRRLEFEPSEASLDAGCRILSVTAAARPPKGKRESRSE